MQEMGMDAKTDRCRSMDVGRAAGVSSTGQRLLGYFETLTGDDYGHDTTGSIGSHK